MWRNLTTFSSFMKYLGVSFFIGWDGDGREQKLAEYVCSHAESGNPQSVIKAIDDFATSGTWLMNVGDAKGKILDAQIAKKQPLLVLELGTYCGYSAVRMASQLTRPGAKLVSLELVPGTAEVARKIVDHAGLSDRVEILLAPLSNQVERIKHILKDVKREHFDFVFIDHDKHYYLSDYLLLKDNQLIREGTIVFADNMRVPGCPPFLNYLKTHPDELETTYVDSTIEYIGWMGDMVTISTFHQV